MAKYNYEFKKKVVEDYLNGKGGYKYLATQYGLTDKKLVRQWVANYKAFGDEGLMRSRQQEKYSFEKKLSVEEFYLSNEISYQELAIQEGITNPSMIAVWVSRFRVAGPEALRSRKKGRKRTLDKPKISQNPQEIEERVVDTSAEHVKELEDELLKSLTEGNKELQEQVEELRDRIQKVKVREQNAINTRVRDAMEWTKRNCEIELKEMKKKFLHMKCKEIGVLSVCCVALV